MRADVFVFQAGLTESREKAHALIMAGKVRINGKRVEKPGMDVPTDAHAEIEENAIPFVSRGGLKLEKAVLEFQLSLQGYVSADIGASTGGFTDCMLQHGAKHVYAIDVGYGQLDWRLRNDERVTVMERTNARNMQLDWFQAPLDFASIDVSFISLKLILPALYTCLRDNAQVVALIKPQFEAGRADVGKHGVVRDPVIHRRVCETVLADAKALGFSCKNLTFSPITGPKGNIEFLALLQKEACVSSNASAQHALETMQERIAQIVASAHSVLRE
ncbi:TlyA family RNA methyltransferase [Christensenellaceae bacterium OttesenSCG-928-L17]|nr:TlyA family RNA methyltransferase [Christensenellaceae bacterium OttesenSCG-928-L17]